MPSRMPPRNHGRSSKVGSPGWKSAVDVFKTPKSPSPIRRTTRRSSIYQRKPAKMDITKAKSIVSPPGVKTRARRSSIYQKGGKLLSPGSLPVRTRRTSMYVGTNLTSINEFSKVWATPVKPARISTENEPLLKSPEKKPLRTPRKQVVSPKPKSEKKSARKPELSEVDRSVNMEGPATPKITRKTPAKKMSEKKSGKKTSGSEVKKSENMMVVGTPKLSIKTPSLKKSEKKSTKKTNIAELNQSIGTKGIKTPKASSKSPLLKKSEKMSAKKAERIAVDQSESHRVDTPKLTRKAPKLTKKTPAVRKSAAKTSLKVKTPLKSTTADENQSAKKQKVMKMSTPIKSFEDFTGKSFYSTPKQTPIQKVVDQVKVSNAPPKSSQRRKHVSLTATPKSSVKQVKSAKKQYRKTPKPTKRPSDDELGPSPSPSIKRMKVSEEVSQSAVSADKSKNTSIKTKLSPLEMSSILKSAAQIEKMESEGLSPPRETTPKATNRGKRIMSRKLTEVDMNESNNAEQGTSSVAESLDTTLDLNETIYTDSRSSRCTIL